MKKLIFTLFLFLNHNISAQQPEIFKLKKYETALFAETLKENSGLSFIKGKLYTINDGGNTSDIFEINPQTAQIQKTYPTKLKNIDWEAIASDSTNLYVGDFGNNAGARQDLKIYKIKYDSLLMKSESAETISYFYPEQTDFTRRIINHDFDAEAMIYLNGKLHVFTKEWASRATTHYVIDPNISEVQPAQKIETYNTGFVVTDAEYYKENLYLLGYTKTTEVYLMVFKESQPGIFFENQAKKYYLGSSVSLSQIEGIAADENGIYISGEEFRHPLGKVKPKMYFVPHSKLK